MSLWGDSSVWKLVLSSEECEASDFLSDEYIFIVGIKSTIEQPQGQSPASASSCFHRVRLSSITSRREEMATARV